MSNIYIGIDFGTTNTIIAVYQNEKINIINDDIFTLIPSKIGYYEDKIYCGNYIPNNCNNIISNFKLEDDINKKFILDKEYNFLDLYYIFFKHLYYLINKKYNLTTLNTVITIPSDFSYFKRENIKFIFEKVGFTILRMINEPTSAALAYGIYNTYNDNNKILVIDIGGGTTDISILEKCDSFYEVIYSDGINNLGGNNFTQLIIDDIIKNNILVDNISKIAEIIKEKLSVIEFYENLQINYYLSRDKFNLLSSNLIDILKEYLLKIKNNYIIDNIILVGGSSKIPLIQDTINSIFQNNIKIYSNLEYVVAEGAAFYANIINNKNSNLILLSDIISYSIGVELADSSYSIIIPKNSVLPIKISEKYTVDNMIDNIVKINFYQGDHKIANKNNLLCELVFDKITKDNLPIIDITIKVDLNSLITITVIDRKSGNEKNIIINNYKFYKENINDVTIDNINDDEELNKNKNIYLIKNHIYNLLQNISINNLISNNDKNAITNKIKIIEESMNTMNNLQLIETLNDLQNNYSLIIEQNISNQTFCEIKKFVHENYSHEQDKKDMIEIINDLIIKYPKYLELFNNILDKLKHDNLSNDYIKEQKRFLNDIIETIL